MIIITGFGPYGSYINNVSSLIVKEIEATNFNIKIVKGILPVSWDFSITLYKKILNKLPSKPKFVILMGIHSNKSYSLENISWNFAFGKDVDNRFKFGVIEYKLNLWLKSSFDISNLYSTLNNIIDIRLSYFAGFYLCNYIYYLALSISQNQYPVLFIHIPHKEPVNKGVAIVKRIIRTMISIL